jgi:glycerophosphoryl diester phosphodiesterase
MEILAHRGQWLATHERNGLEAFARAFLNGHGAEVDVRDRDGELVVSHDVPGAGALPLAAVLDAHRDAGAPGTLALNVKADGLQDLLKAALRDLPAGWFLFDMAVPDAVVSTRHGLPCFTRHSDVEPDPVLYAQSGGVWLDDLSGAGWVTEDRIAAHLAAGKRVAVVSPELHGRPHAQAWAAWRAWDVWTSPDVLLCTDLPSEALEVLA